MNYFVQEFNQIQSRFCQLLMQIEKDLRSQTVNKSIPPNKFMSKWDAFLLMQEFYKSACMAVASLIDEADEFAQLKSELDRTKTRLALLLEQARSYGLDTSLLAWANKKDLIHYQFS